MLYRVLDLVHSRHQTARGARVFAQQIRQGRERWSGESQ